MNKEFAHKYFEQPFEAVQEWLEKVDYLSWPERRAILRAISLSGGPIFDSTAGLAPLLHSFFWPRCEAFNCDKSSGAFVFATFELAEKNVPLMPQTIWGAAEAVLGLREPMFDKERIEHLPQGFEVMSIGTPDDYDRLEGCYDANEYRWLCETQESLSCLRNWAQNCQSLTPACRKAVLAAIDGTGLETLSRAQRVALGHAIPVIQLHFREGKQ